MAERRDQVRVTARRQDAVDLLHYLLGPADVLQHRVALHALEDGVLKRQLVSIRGDVDARDGKQIEIDEARHRPARAADIEIPTAQGKVLGLTRIHDQGGRRLQRAPQPRPCGAAAVKLPEVHYFAFGSILTLAGRVNRSSFKPLLISTESENISKILSPLRSRRMSKGHWTPPPTSRYLAKRLTSVSKSLYSGLRRRKTCRTGSLLV